MHHRLNNFDFLRLLAALFVLFSHQHALSGLKEPSVLNVHTLGGLGVLMFFSISGFLVAQSWQADPNVLRFASKRMLRIWPGLAVALTLSAFVLGPAVSQLSLVDYFSHPTVADYYVKNLQFALRDMLPLRFEGNALPTAINGSLWTIPLELKCYLALGILGVSGLLRVRWVWLAIMLTLVFFYSVWEPRGDHWIDFMGWSLEKRFLLEFGLFFFAGAAFHALSLHKSARNSLFALAVCWTLAAGALTLGRPLLFLWLVVPVTVLVVGNASTPYLRRLGRFGDVSYGMYIYAFPVQQTLIWLFKESLSWWSVLGLTLAITYALAFASWHLVEKHALKLKPTKKTRVSADTPRDADKLNSAAGS
jgi:peptidoglycan/LPS O-acetylase OafA/YrhL